MRQREIFLSGEGDNWFLRNQKAIQALDSLDVDFLIRNLLEHKGVEQKFLEIGCSNGIKTERLSRELGWGGFGIDPSRLAIEDARLRKPGCSFEIGTADRLPFKANSFDLCFYAFCLYLVDRNDITQVFEECTRVLKSDGFVAILDFDFGKEPRNNPYIHDSRMFSFKEDYVSHLSNLGFRVIAKESYREGRIGVDPDPDRRYSITLFQRF